MLVFAATAHIVLRSMNPNIHLRNRLTIPSYICLLNTQSCTMPQTKQEPITFSKKVDENGRLVVPQEIRQALQIDGREALVEFDASKITYLEGGEDE